MRISAKKWRWIGLGFALAAVAFLVVRTWVVPAVIVSQIKAKYRGRVVVGNWWFGLHSAGLENVSLGEGPEADSPEWASAERITVDVSLASLIRGRVTPRKIQIDRPKVKFRLDAKGQPITKIPLAPEPPGPAQKPAPLPEIDAHDAEITLEQAGRKPMTITHVEASLRDGDGQESLKVQTDDPTWGQVAVTGHFDEAFKNGVLEIDSSPNFVADPEKLERIPFIPAEVWANIEPRGPVVAKVKITLAADAPKPVRVLTDLTLKGTSARLETLQVTSTRTTGHVVIDDALVKVLELKGDAVDGSIAATGTLDFSVPIPRFDLDLRLQEVDVTKTPPSWQLNELQATGKLSGKVALKVTLPPAGPDLTGTSGEAVIENGSFQGIPIKSLSIGLSAEGGDLRYETTTPGSVRREDFDGPPRMPGASPPATVNHPGPKAHHPGKVDITEPLLDALPIIRIATQDQGVLGWSAYVASEVVAFQAKQQAPGRTGGFKLPKTISTKIELEDVDLTTILAKAEKLGIKIPVPVAGRLSIKLAATIPIGALKDIKEYTLRGDATLKGASIDHVDLGLLSTHLELVNGVLDLSDFRGQLVDRPSGSDKNPPKPTAIPPKTGPLPPGAFRGNVHASISPMGPASAKFEGQQLPIGELAAPFLPVPTPVSGELTLQVQAGVNVADLSNPKSWTLDGHLDSRRIRYQEAVLDEVAASVRVKDARLDVADFTARLMGHPLQVRGGLGLAAPYPFNGKLSIAGWEIANVLAFVPGMPKPAPASGVVDAIGDAQGTLQPFTIRTQGGVRIARARVGPASLGHVVFQWTTGRDAVAITGLEAHTFGGKLTGEATIPIVPGRKLEATVTLKGVDTAMLSSTLTPGSLAITGRADGRAHVSMPLDAAVIDADAHLVAPELLIREGTAGDGIRVTSLQFKARARKGVLDYQAEADTLGGKVRFHGTAPASKDLARAMANAEFQATGFRLNPTWRGLGISGGLAELDGDAMLDANIRASLSPFHLWAHGLFELQKLHYGRHLDLGHLRGQVAMTPTTWRVEQVYGDLLGGVATGAASGESKPGQPRMIAFDFKVDRASMARILASVPMLGKGADGFGSLRISGLLQESLRATAELSVPRARILGLPVSDLRFPAEIDLSPSTGIGALRSRHWQARVAGGSARGNVYVRLGEDRSFQTEVQFSEVDLELLARLDPTSKKAASGKVSGKISLNGVDPTQLAKMRGKVDVDLDDASLVELPVFKELDRFLGGARGGGLFQDGDLHGTIYNRTVFVERLTLQGKLIQIHATGSVTFDGGLNLEVLVNTNQIIPESGLAIVGLVPGLGQALGRGEEAIMRVANFLENRLLKFRVSGTVSNPTVQIDTGVAVGEGAAGFFSSVLKVPLGGGR